MYYLGVLARCTTVKGYNNKSRLSARVTVETLCSSIGTVAVECSKSISVAFLIGSYSGAMKAVHEFYYRIHASFILGSSLHD